MVGIDRLRTLGSALFSSEHDLITQFQNESLGDDVPVVAAESKVYTVADILPKSDMSDEEKIAWFEAHYSVDLTMIQGKHPRS